MIPGEIDVAQGEIEINQGRETVTLEVANSGDRPVQVGSHYHFYETNPGLVFERAEATQVTDMGADPVWAPLRRPDRGAGWLLLITEKYNILWGGAARTKLFKIYN